MCIPHAGTPVNSAFNRRIENENSIYPRIKKHDLQAKLRKISNRRRPNLITKGFYLQCRKKMVCTYHGQIKRATKKFDYGCQAQSKLRLSWTGLLYPQLIHHISISIPQLINKICMSANYDPPPERCISRIQKRPTCTRNP